ncbi:MAG TPA: M23 family metallopeptidase [Vicinamibacterales bacterium]|nr:M23 family metallopeptidase [Vicinamibacterales bacterium]
MTRRRSSLVPLVPPTIGGVITGVAVAWLFTSHQAALGSGAPALSADGADENRAAIVAPATPTPLPVAKASPALEVSPTRSESASDLRARHLLIPLAGVEPSALRDSFDDARDHTRRHEALDILAPRNTPVRAVEGGTIAKLFLSKAGGITLCQFDPTETYAYYYAHLERYAPGLHERQTVSAGDIIGYVGTSGNAPPDTPHLHFAIFKLTPEKHWWQGEAIDPFRVWR